MSTPVAKAAAALPGGEIYRLWRASVHAIVHHSGPSLFQWAFFSPHRHLRRWPVLDVAQAPPAGVGRLRPWPEPQSTASRWHLNIYRPCFVLRWPKRLRPCLGLKLTASNMPFRPLSGSAFLRKTSYSSFYPMWRSLRLSVLSVYWLRLRTPNCGGLGLKPNLPHRGNS